MPSWEIHIEIAKRLNEKLNYKENELQLFMLGNILPDINNCHMVKDMSKKLGHRVTHFRLIDDNSYINFYNQYTALTKKNPLFLGYYIHLYLDYYWNKDFFKKFSPSITKQEHDDLNVIKQRDFKLYSYNYYNNKIDINNYENILSEINKIEELHITKEDLEKVVKYFEKREKEKIEYKYYTKQELDKLLEETIIKIEEIIDNIKN